MKIGADPEITIRILWKRQSMGRLTLPEYGCRRTVRDLFWPIGNQIDFGAKDLANQRAGIIEALR